MRRLVRLGLFVPLLLGIGASLGCHDDDHHHVSDHRVIIEDHRDRDHHNHDHRDWDRHHQAHDHDHPDHHN